MSVVTRFAPSPTGWLHLGHAFSAYCSWTKARESSGAFRLRLEDIDAARCKPEFTAAVLEDLAWLGFHWDGEVRVQSAYLAQYRAALDRLEERGLLYPCFCSRADIAAAQAAPHEGEAPKYPGTCRGLSAAVRIALIESGAPYALRLDVQAALRQVTDLRFFDVRRGWVTAEPGRFGDGVLARRDIPASYHFCVVYDDALQGITHVIRGEDLREVTHIHVLLQLLLDLPTPVYGFHKLIRDDAGRRLAKRDQAASLRAMRAAGVDPAAIVARLREWTTTHMG